MLIQKLSIILVCILVFAGTALAQSGMPDLCLSTASMPGAPYQTISLFSVPNGSYLAFNQAQIYNDGTVVDATIILTLMDVWGDPISNFPAEDMWIESVDGGMVPCIGGAMADADTDVYGETRWAEPLRAGGHSMSGCQVMVNGNALCQPPFDMYFNSADVNGDGVVNLADLNLFAAAFFNHFDYSIDFYPDGELSLSDVGRFANALGASCQ